MSQLTALFFVLFCCQPSKGGGQVVFDAAALSQQQAPGKAEETKQSRLGLKPLSHVPCALAEQVSVSSRCLFRSVRNIAGKHYSSSATNVTFLTITPLEELTTLNNDTNRDLSWVQTHKQHFGAREQAHFSVVWTWWCTDDFERTYGRRDGRPRT